MGNIECILATVNNLSDSDLKILANLIMDRLNPEKAFASPMKIVPRMECPVCHRSAHVVRNGHKHGKQAFLCGHVESHLLQQVTLFCLAHITAVMSGKPSLLTRLWAYPLMTPGTDSNCSISRSVIPVFSL